MNKIILMAATAMLGMAAPVVAQDVTDNPAVEAALNQNNVMTVRNIARTELSRGMQIYDAGGKPVGIVDQPPSIAPQSRDPPGSRKLQRVAGLAKPI